ncbi:MAG TPA: glycosyltransferase family A protein [Stellaceae bacterium]|nr:glycosyltransferase family A protein [Stellaceae bacterium]
MSGVLISFVVPAYNEESLLASCLEAILAEIARARCPAEIIVVNNSSTDRTREIAASFGAVAIIDEPHRGLVRARRAGCLAARGRLIANIDADTILPPGWIDTVLAEFARQPGLVALSGPFIHYDMSRTVRIIVAVFYQAAFLSYLLVRFVFRAGSMLQGGNFVVARSALDAAEAFNLDFSFYGEDTELARRLSKLGAVKFSFALPAFSSGRRLAAEGLLQVAFRYSINYLWTVVFRRPYSSGWLDFRHPVDISDAPLTSILGVRSEPPERLARLAAIDGYRQCPSIWPPGASAGRARCGRAPPAAAGSAPASDPSSSNSRQASSFPAKPPQGGRDSSSSFDR